MSGKQTATLIVAASLVISAAGLVVEIVGGRMLAPYLGMSIYTWTAVIAVVLAGFSAGHAVGGYYADRSAGEIYRLTGHFMALAAMTTAFAPQLLAAVAQPVIGASGTALTAIVLLATIIFFVPSLAVSVPSAPFAKLLIGLTGERSGPWLGALFAAGSLGAIGGTVAAGFLFIPFWGTRTTLLTVAAIEIALALAFYLAASRASRPAMGLASVLLAAFLLLATAGAGLTIGRSPCDVESQYFCIRTMDYSAEAGQEARLMVLDHLGHGINLEEPTALYHAYAAIIDNLANVHLGNAPRRAFFVGGGAFTLPRAWAERQEDSASIVVSEIDPQVLEVADDEFWAESARFTVRQEDARLALSREEGGFDAIVADAFTDIAAPQHLITRDYVELVRAKLADDGVFMMNIIDHTDRLDALASMVATIEAVFPVVEVWAEQSEIIPGNRVTFVIFAGGNPTPKPTFVDPLFGRLMSRMPARSMQALLQRDTIVMTDDFAPIDRLLGWDLPPD
ncbi:fused MFS/spermidine synthase [Pararhizobium haloflavum]|uniref:fused MFS/spermidine synthase n=1 Tax=Pararhizobium haloflavum TaxID=2037914 RepID=UPI000C18BED4|nr:fused MFS/spermidine synthase [Pararhizobium haloflavum]